MSDGSSNRKHIYALLNIKKITVILSVMVLAISLIYLSTTIFGVPLNS